MSTYWYFECLDHNPPLRSEEEFTQHTGDSAFNRAIELAQSRPVTYEWHSGIGESVDTYFEGNARQFLVKHPTCCLQIMNEYGFHGPIPEKQDG